MIFHPTMDRVIIRPIDLNEEIAGLKVERLHVNAELKLGEIIAAGPDAPFKYEGSKVGSALTRFLHWLFKINRKPYTIGQKVFYTPAAGTTIKRLMDKGGWEELRIMHSDSLQCIIDD